jgi:hypothetical protein
MKMNLFQVNFQSQLASLHTGARHTAGMVHGNRGDDSKGGATVRGVFFDVRCHSAVRDGKSGASRAVQSDPGL